jgi:hypothetical protein
MEEGKNGDWFSARVSRKIERESSKRKETALLRAMESTRKNSRQLVFTGGYAFKCFYFFFFTNEILFIAFLLHRDV